MKEHRSARINENDMKAEKDNKKSKLQLIFSGREKDKVSVSSQMNPASLAVSNEITPSNS